MAAKSTYLETQLLNLVFRTQVAWKPAAVWIRLYTVAPTDAGGGTEVTGGSYAAQQVTQLDANWDAPAGSPRATQNTNAIPFPTATADWGTVVAWAAWDAATAGNMLYWGAITPSKAVPNGATASFAAGALDVSED